jgi:hypothetical protein
LKEAIRPFSTLLLKVQKRHRSAIIVPVFFFVRRFATALVLAFPLDNKFVFFQYAAITLISNIWALYLTNIRPYKTTMFNMYMATNETFYSLISLYALIFTDSQIQIIVKIFGGIAIITSIFVLIAANFIMVFSMICYGRERLKRKMREEVYKRAEQEIYLTEERIYNKKLIEERDLRRFGGIRSKNIKD